METIAYVAIITSAAVLVGALAYAFVVRKKEIDIYTREKDFVTKIGHVQGDSEQLHEKSQHLIEHARQTAQRILEDAMTRSGSIIKQADTFQQQIEQESRSTFLEASYEYSKKFEAELKEMVANYRRLFASSEETAINSANALIEEQKVLSAQLLKQHIDNQIKKFDDDMAEYKEAQMQRISKQADAAVVRVIKRVVGSSFTDTDHELLIKNSLEEAKKEGFFDL